MIKTKNKLFFQWRTYSRVAVDNPFISISIIMLTSKASNINIIIRVYIIKGRASAWKKHNKKALIWKFSTYKKMAASFPVMAGSFTQVQTIDTINLKLPHSMTSLANTILNNSNVNSQLAKRQKFKLEPIKILESSNKKLNLPESQRIIYIVEELINRLEILDYLPLMTSNDNTIRNILRANLNEEEKKKNFEQIFMSLCLHHWTISETYDRGEFKKRDSAHTKDSLELLIKNSCKELLRFMQKKPVFFDEVKKELAMAKPPSNPKINELKCRFLKIYIIFMRW